MTKNATECQQQMQHEMEAEEQNSQEQKIKRTLDR